MDGQNWRGLKWIELILGKFEKRRPTFFQIYISLYQNVIYKAGKSFSSCYVGVILQMKHSCSANLTFRAHN